MTMRKHHTCTVPDCGKPHEAQGFCPKHYRRFKLYGDPLGRATRQYELLCAVDDCGRPRRGLAWCTKHYQRMVTWGDVNAVRYATSDRRCAVEGCDGKHQSNGLCGKHYRRQMRTGSTEDAGKPYTGKHHADGYILVYLPEHPNARDGNILEHRLVMSMMLQRPLTDGESVHHVNGDRTDNRPENLELWSTVQPSGQRVEDKVRWAREILAQYGELFPE